MILREMPRVSDPNYAREFYRWWGTRNCVILAQAKRAEYSRYQQAFSIKMASGGSEEYFVERRRVAVDDDSYLVLNEGRIYGSSIAARVPIESFCVFFRPGLMAEVGAALPLREGAILEPLPHAAAAVELSEHLRLLDTTVAPVLRFIRWGVLQGASGDEWLEDQFTLLAERVWLTHSKALAAASAFAQLRAATRREILRRLHLGADFLLSNYRRDVRVAEAAAAAAMSRFHFSRMFREAFACTPQEYLRRKRVAVAQRLLRQSARSVDEVADHVGLGTRSALFRAMRAVAGTTPRAWRTLGRDSH